jgi:beta-galactosidase
MGMVGTETESCVSTRGYYDFPVEEERDRHRPSLQVTSYDVSGPPWGYSPDYEFAAQAACPYILGQFTWTGFDYLGEPTPYKQEWPTRSSYFGIVDLCGFPKDRYYLYQSQWTSDPVLHIVPHWTWPGREGEVTPVHVYTGYETAELFLNGRSLGVRRKNPAAGAPAETFIGEDPAMDTIFGRHRLIWEDVCYEPGVLKVVALNAGGDPVDEAEVHTAGPPARVELRPDRREIAADGVDLAFVTVRILDAEGHLCPQAANRVTFDVGGAGELVATGNGDPTCLTPFASADRDAFHGLALLIVRARRGQSGAITVRAGAAGLTGSEVVIASRESGSPAAER